MTPVLDTQLNRKILEILDDVASLSPDERVRHVKEVCGNDPELEQEVLSHLTYFESETITEFSREPVPMPVIRAYDEFERRYELGEQIARGGVGIIRKAFDRDLGRTVAVKVLRDKFKDTPDMVLRFVTEARISARLTHPGITPVHEIGRLPEGNPYIAMKLVEGCSFASLLKARKNSLDELDRFLGIFEKICQTVAYAHSRSVIHRDLKPDNVMVSSFGEVQVVDWGLAKTMSGLKGETDLRHDRIGDVESETNHTDTMVGTILGTPAYMAPEQTVGLLIPQIDVFSLGGILCEILTGRPTYQGKDADEILLNATEGNIQDAHDRLRNCGAESGLVELAIDCLSPDMRDRPVDAEALSHRMTEYRRSTLKRIRQVEIENEQAAVLAIEHRRRSRIKFLATCIGFALVIAATIVFYNQETEHVANIAAVEYAEKQDAERVSYWATMLAAFREHDAGNHYQAYRILDSSPENLRSWEWHYLRKAIDANSWNLLVRGRKIDFAIALTNQSRIALIDESGVTQFVDIDSRSVIGEVRSPQGRPMAVSDDGSFVLSLIDRKAGTDTKFPGNSSQPVLWETRTGQIIRTFDPISVAAGQASKRQFSVSPGGRYISTTSSGGQHAIAIHDTRTGQRIQTFDVGLKGRGGAFSPDGEQFVYSSPRQIHFWDIANARPARAPIEDAARVLTFSHDGKKLAGVRQDNTLIWNLNDGTHVTVPLKLAPRQNTFVEFSPDGSELVAALGKNSVRVWSTVTGGLLRQLGINEQMDSKLGHYSWIDDKLLVPSNGDEGSPIKLWNLKQEDSHALRGHTAYVYPVAITSDGSRVVSGGWDKTVRIWDADSKQELFACDGHGSFLHDLDIDDRNRRFASIDMAGQVCLWDLDDGKLLRSQQVLQTKGTVSKPKHIIYNGVTDSYFAHSTDRILELDSSNLSVIQSTRLNSSFSNTMDVHVSPDGAALVLSIAESPHSSRLVFLDTETLEETLSLNLDGLARAVAYSPDGSKLAVGFIDGAVGLWNLGDFEQPLWIKDEHVGEVFGMVFSQDGSRLFTGGRDTTIRIWDTKDGTVFGPLLGHSNYIYSLDINADGSRLVSGSGDASVRLWESRPMQNQRF